MTDSVENLLMALRHLHLCQMYIYNGLQLCFFSVKEKNCVCVLNNVPNSVYTLNAERVLVPFDLN